MWLYGPLSTFVHPTHLNDPIGALVRVLDHDDLHREVLNIGGERTVDFRELVTLVAKRLGRSPL